MINIAGSVIIQGMGDLTVIDINGNYSCFNITGAASCVLRDFKIDATDLTAEATKVIDVNVHNVIIDNIYIIGDGTNGHGIYIENGRQHFFIKNCRIINLYIGIYIISDFGYVTDNFIYGNKVGIMTGMGCDHVSIIGNKCYINKIYGIYINSSIHWEIKEIY